MRMTVCFGGGTSTSRLCVVERLRECVLDVFLLMTALTWAGRHDTARFSACRLLSGSFPGFLAMVSIYSSVHLLKHHSMALFVCWLLWVVQTRACANSDSVPQTQTPTQAQTQAQTQARNKNKKDKKKDDTKIEKTRHKYYVLVLLVCRVT
ncbi:hypothetical protein BD289DRAFT_447374 [Coniella lustricola]|uniref:Uncharacterized protein n=1 Tax=Coniella lustricola TaxID=2025994 RepID=A0A2T2ZT50_9PEZI|nr:hypothetical protein BD289DRAFT_447374 [Coniella lustricola]